ncbi:hypothetical protein LCGC14_1021670 [marine sediment metagenome]|uniref:Uncharacterized protein n=1 Tax=marine sediment metagenome TaxID=412755 RepID=A0A0F9N1S4_9ZZZZ
MGPRINGARLHFLYENVSFLAKWSLAPFILHLFWGQKQRVFELYSLSFFRETLLIFLLKLRRPLLE